MQLSALLIWGSSAWAQAPALDSLSAQFNVYTDEGITAWAPSARVRVNTSPVVQIGAWWNADFVSGATPVIATDTVTTATPFEESRHGGTVDVVYAPSPRWSWSAAATGSTESDHQVLLGSLGGTFTMADEHTRLSAQGAVGVIWDGTRAEPDRAGSSLDTALDLGWTQILGRTTSGSVRITTGYANCNPEYGCGASAYRFVPQGPLFLPEHHPAERARLASAAAVAQSLGTTTALHANYRYSHDSWGVSGHTVGLALAQGLWQGRALLRLESRGVSQSAASFWRDGYDDVAEYRTADRELSGLLEGKLGLRLRWNVHGQWHTRVVSFDLHLDRVWYRYPEYGALPERNAWIVGGGIDARW